MKVYCRKSGREAAWRIDRDSGEEGYFATPPGTGKHTKSNAKRFQTIEDLGFFLVKNPTWKIYVGDAQLNTDIVVEGIIDLATLRSA